MESNFGKTDVPLYTGRITGLRSFAVTSDGQLTGVTYAGRWADGENQAKCALTDSTFYSFESNDGAERYFSAPKPEHRVGGIDCTCGYYGYFAGNDNEFQAGVHVESVIEAWGKMTLGNRGFRASKARIVALVIPEEVFPDSWVQKFSHRVSCKARTFGPHGWSYPYLANEAECQLPLFPFPSLMGAIRKRYPSAQTFNSIEEAVAAFPLTPVEVANQIVSQ